MRPVRSGRRPPSCNRPLPAPVSALRTVQTEDFAARHPLSCHAQKDVIHWLEQRITHNAPQVKTSPLFWLLP